MSPNSKGSANLADPANVSLPTRDAMWNSEDTTCSCRVYPWEKPATTRSTLVYTAERWDYSSDCNWWRCGRRWPGYMRRQNCATGSPIWWPLNLGGLLARVNCWNEMENATYLPVSLNGQALTVLSNIPRDNLYNYPSLITALEARFGCAHQAELHRIQLKNRTRKREESLAELAEELARLAYPEAPQEMLDLLAKDQFIDALADGDMWLRLRQSHPKSLQTALELKAANQQWGVSLLKRR